MGMIVKELLDEARERLVTIAADALLVEAASALANMRAELVIVCDFERQGDRRDHAKRCRFPHLALRGIGVSDDRGGDDAGTGLLPPGRPGERCVGQDETAPVAAHPHLDDRFHPVGVNARDPLQALLMSAANETELLREYVMSVGYR